MREAAPLVADQQREARAGPQAVDLARPVTLSNAIVRGWSVPISAVVVRGTAPPSAASSSADSDSPLVSRKRQSTSNMRAQSKSASALPGFSIASPTSVPGGPITRSTPSGSTPRDAGRRSAWRRPRGRGFGRSGPGACPCHAGGRGARSRGGGRPGARTTPGWRPATRRWSCRPRGPPSRWRLPARAPRHRGQRSGPASAKAVWQVVKGDPPRHAKTAEARDRVAASRPGRGRVRPSAARRAPRVQGGGGIARLHGGRPDSGSRDAVASR